MYGVLDFYAACREAGINPVIGTEAYMAAESRHERPVRRGKVDDTGGDVAGGEKLYYHLTLLAETTEGYRNLLKLSSAAYLEGYYYKPRLDWELLARHATGPDRHHRLPGRRRPPGPAGRRPDQGGGAGRPAPGHLRARTTSSSSSRTTACPSSTRPTRPWSRSPGGIGAPLLATNDSHYTHREDHVAHDALLCVQTGALIDDPKRFKFEGEEHYLKSAAEMRHLFAELPEACDNTLLIAERANVEIDFGAAEPAPLPGPRRVPGRHLRGAGRRATCGT